LRKNSKELEAFVKESLDKLESRLTGGRAKASHTVKMYLATAREFLEYTGKTRDISSQDVDKYIKDLREKGQQEVTLRGKMFRIKKLNTVCEFFTWNFSSNDIPTPPADYQEITQVATLDQLGQLIRAQEKLTPGEKFYLAVSTIFGCRREAMCQMNTRSISGDKITVPGVKGGRSITHLIPPEMVPIFTGYHVKTHSGQALSQMFHKIAKKAKLETPKAFKSQGMGWHSIRRGLTTLADQFIVLCKTPDNKPVGKSSWADFCGWSKQEKGRTFMGSATAGDYTYFQSLYNDEFWLDKAIYEQHPLLQVWRETLEPKAKRGKK
jgi:biotin operon repressor